MDGPITIIEHVRDTPPLCFRTVLIGTLFDVPCTMLPHKPHATLVRPFSCLKRWS